jgi:hypothetical protein
MINKIIEQQAVLLQRANNLLKHTGAGSLNYNIAAEARKFVADYEAYLKLGSGEHDRQVKAGTTVGIYDSLYKCAKCGKENTESADNPESYNPKNGCKN